MKNFIFFSVSVIFLNFTNANSINQNIADGYVMSKVSSILVSVEKESSSLNHPTSLGIVDREISSVAVNTFKDLNITDLSIESRPGRLNIHRDSFNGLPNLRNLEFISGIISLEKNLFEKVPLLESLSLTVNGSSRILKDNLPRLPNLRKLEITNSNLTEIDSNSFFNFYTTITHLKLIKNNIIWIEPKTFAPLRNLKHLFLELDALLSIHIRTFEFGLEKLETLTLILHRVVYLGGMGIFNNLKKLLELKIDGPLLEFIGPNAFNGLNIHELKLNGITTTTIEDQIFSGLQNLKTLDLSSNRINRINNGSFSNLELSKLNLENNTIRNIDYGSFHGLKTKVLILSNNNISKIENGEFSGSEIEELHLAKNNLVHLKNMMFEGISKLTVLSLNSNQIFKIDSGVFFGYNLTILSLEDNHLVYLGKRSFVGLICEHMILTKNVISHIEPDTFQGSTISELYLSENKLQTVEAGMFNKMKELKILDLSLNKIDRILSNPFSKLILFTLNLKKNDLTLINRRTFHNLETEVLDLSWNKIVEIKPGAFDRSQIKSLILNHNKLSHLEEEVLNKITNLKILKLNDNNFKSINARAFSGMNLSYLDLTNNELLYVTNSYFQGLICNGILLTGVSSIGMINASSIHPTTHL